MRLGVGIGITQRAGASDAISGALATRAGIAVKPWKYATTLFTDTAGTVAASAAGDIIAVAKDDSRGLIPTGPELVTNGSFATDTDWTKAAGWTISGGTLNGNTGAFATASQAGSYTAGKIYEVTMTVTVSSGYIVVYIGSGISEQINSSSTSTLFLVAAGASTFFIGGFSFVGSIDNVSVKEAPYGVYQQTTLANRAILTRWPKAGKRNLFKWTEDLDNAVWEDISAGATTVTPGQSDPDGGNAAFLLVGNNTNTYYAQNVGATLAGNRTISFWAKSDVANTIEALFSWGATDTTTLNLTTSWQEFSFTAARADTPNLYGGINIGNAKNIYIYQPQMEVGATATAYQKVTTAYDITESGQANCWGLTFDGTNDSMATAATLNLSGSDKVGVFVGATTLTDAATSIIFEHSATIATNSGAWYSAKENSRYQAQSRGTAPSLSNQVTSTLTGYDIGDSSVISFFGNIAGDSTIARVDGVASGTPASGDQGAGNYGNYTNYIGARAASSLFFNGICWGAAIVSTLTTADATTITAIERQIAANTPTIVAPVATVAPTVSGAVYVGSLLTSTTGTWTGSPTYTYQWTRDGVDIAAATSSTYTTVSADIAATVRCVVTGTNFVGATSATSNGVAVLAFTPAALYLSGEAGDWFDPSDLSKMWQDTAGTTPITADGQTVARIDGQRGLVSLRQATAAQRAQYKTSGGLHWLQFDGTDDRYDSSAVVDFSASDRITVSIAMSKASDASERRVLEFGVVGVDAGTFRFQSPNGAAANYSFSAHGTATQTASYTNAAVAAPHTGVLTGLAEISPAQTTLRVNGAQVATSASSLGTGNFSSRNLKLGAAWNSSLYHSGNVYALVLRGDLTSGADLTSLETYMGAKAGLTI